MVPELLDRKEKQIVDLEKRVDYLEKSADDVQQYSRRPNLCIHGFSEADTQETTDQMIVNLVNSGLHVNPPIQVEHLERSHRLGPKVSENGKLDIDRSSLALGASDYETLSTDRVSI